MLFGSILKSECLILVLKEDKLDAIRFKPEKNCCILVLTKDKTNSIRFKPEE